MIPNRIIRQWLEYPRLAPHSLSIFWFRSMDGTPVHAASRRVARLAALSFPPKGKNVFAPMKQLSKERDLFFWRVDIVCHTFPRRSYPRNEANKQPILQHAMWTNWEQIGNRLGTNYRRTGVR